jgi:DNA repair photolyase
MTFDTYSNCAFNCVYCFSQYQRGVGKTRGKYEKGVVRSVNVENVKAIFTNPESSQFGTWVKARRPMQWGGLSDQFDAFERKYGVTLELMRFFREIEYPLTFSTKATWWVYDQRYREVFDGMPWNVKFSIITLDERKAALIERGVPTPEERLAAMHEAAGFARGGVTLRLRPFIIGVSDPHHVELIKRAAQAGAGAVTTEFFCLEQRSPWFRAHGLPAMERACGFDVMEFYRRYSSGMGYLRLNRNVKRKFVQEMQDAAKEAGLRFYVSDAHFKERCDNGCCCGLSKEWAYSRGQNAEALLIAKERGTVRWSDISCDLEHTKGYLWRNADGFNSGSAEVRAKFNNHTMFDWLRYHWNHPESWKSPYRMFEGVLEPQGVDDQGDVIYAFNTKRQ